jgi:hypothetical protein
VLAKYLSSSRKVNEIEFADPEKSVKLGRFDAFDYFGDGSFYLLDSPGVGDYMPYFKRKC